MDLWFYDANQGFAIGAYGMIFRTEDGGKNWQSYNAKLPNPERLHLNSITQVGPNALTIVGEMGLFLRSDDLGKTWVKQYSPYEGSLFGLVASGEHQLLFGLRGHVYHSNDAGISWQAVATHNEQTLLGGAKGKNQTCLLVMVVQPCYLMLRINSLLRAILKDAKPTVRLRKPKTALLYSLAKRA